MQSQKAPSAAERTRSSAAAFRLEGRSSKTAVRYCVTGFMALASGFPYKAHQQGAWWFETEM